MTVAELQEFINTWWPIVLAGLLSVAAFVGGAYIIFSQLKKTFQPLIDLWNKWRDKDDETALVNTKFEDIKLNALKIDLMAKIESVAISDEHTMLYQNELDKLNELTSKVTTAVDTVEETINPYL